MVIYQVLCSVPRELETEWRTWMIREHIPEVLQTKMFSRAHIARVLEPQSSNHVQYCIQYLAPSLEHYQRYRTEFAPALQQAHTTKYGTSVTIQRSVMEVLEPEFVAHTDSET